MRRFVSILILAFAGACGNPLETDAPSANTSDNSADEDWGIALVLPGQDYYAHYFDDSVKTFYRLSKLEIPTLQYQEGDSIFTLTPIVRFIAQPGSPPPEIKPVSNAASEPYTSSIDSLTPLSVWASQEGDVQVLEPPMDGPLESSLSVRFLRPRTEWIVISGTDTATVTIRPSGREYKPCLLRPRSETVNLKGEITDLDLWIPYQCRPMLVAGSELEMNRYGAQPREHLFKPASPPWVDEISNPGISYEKPRSLESVRESMRRTFRLDYSLEVTATDISTETPVDVEVSAVSFSAPVRGTLMRWVMPNAEWVPIDHISATVFTGSSWNPDSLLVLVNVLVSKPSYSFFSPPAEVRVPFNRQPGALDVPGGVIGEVEVEASVEIYGSIDDDWIGLGGGCWGDCG